ncbi:MAG TPA: IS110 family transposase [Marmoricola sp.]|nr:IS110 family transposase [Marmoricola sp.]
MGITCGVDWAEDHHDVVVMDDLGKVLQGRRIDTGVDGYAELLALIADHGGSATETPVALETDKNLLVLALRAGGFTVYPINPRAVARYRERHYQAGKKSDHGDASVLADILRTDRHQHRPLPAVSDQALTIKALARQHQEAIWALHQTTSRLRSMLLEFYPQALKAFPNLNHKAALTILAAAPTPTAAQRLTGRRVVALLHRCGRRNDPDLVDRILSALTAPALRQPAPVEKAMGLAAKSLIDILTQMHAAVGLLNDALTEEFSQHQLAPVLTSAPGLGAVLAARILGEVGDDLARFESPANLRAFAGTAPVTRASGRSSYVKARKVRNKRLGDACHWWAFSTLTKSQGARAHYDHRRAIGDTHNAALRNLSNKLLGRLWWCIQNQQPWDEAAAWPAVTHTSQASAA